MNEQELKAWDVSAQTVIAEMKDNRNARKQARRVRILIADLQEAQDEIDGLMQTVRHVRRFVETVTGERDHE